jgi:uncharacterized Zn-finger protein
MGTGNNQGDARPTVRNDGGLSEVRIGARRFSCIGASPPQDHPAIFLQIGHGECLLCPYCNTCFRHDPALGPGGVDPPSCRVD